MSYKEIQIPSSDVKKALTGVLAELVELLPASDEKVQKERQAYKDFKKSEEEIYRDLIKRVAAITPKGDDLHHRDAMKRVVLNPRRFDEHIYYFFDAFPNLTSGMIEAVRSLLEAAELSETLTMTEPQVKNFKYYKDGGAVSHIKEWLKVEKKFESLYSENIAVIEKAEEEFYKKVPASESKKEVKPAQEVEVQGSTVLGWAVFAGIMTAVLFLIFG